MPFTTLKLIFRGFDGLEELTVNDKPAPLQREVVRLLDPLAYLGEVCCDQGLVQRLRDAQLMPAQHTLTIANEPQIVVRWQ